MSARKQKDQKRLHIAKDVQQDPNAARRRDSLAKYAEAFGISYSRGGMRPRLLP